MTEDNIRSNKKNTRGKKTTTVNTTCPFSEKNLDIWQRIIYDRLNKNTRGRKTTTVNPTRPFS